MLVFDGRFIRAGSHDGISRFSASLVSELHKIRPITVMLSDSEQLRHLPPDIDYFFECAPTSFGELGLARRLNRRGVTTLYSPMQTTGKIGARFKVILTLHDLIYYQHRRPPSEFNILVRLLWRLYHLSFVPGRLILKGASGLVTISETSKHLIQRNRLFQGPIEVIYNAADKIESGKLEGNRSKRICYMGSFMPYKDVETLIRAVANSDYELHLLSGISQQRRTRLEALTQQLGAKVIFHDGVSDREYASLLSGSFALVSASRAEGFGIPLVEAMSVGVPVVCSDIEIFREVGADAALYFEPGNFEQLRERLSQLGTEWRSRSQASLTNAQRFSWSASAQKLSEFIDSVV